MVQRLNKEQLFLEYFRALYDGFDSLEFIYDVTGLVRQVFGSDIDGKEVARYTDSDDFIQIRQPDKSTEIAVAMGQIRTSVPWKHVDELYSFAFEGIDPPTKHVHEIINIVDMNVAYLKFKERLSNVWEEMITVAEARSSLDDGDDILLESLALLANVDVRTVRNAASSGDLKTKKVDGERYIKNKSAKTWLKKRREYIPTHLKPGCEIELREITRATDLGSFLLNRKESLFEIDEAQLPSDIEHEILEAIEGGSFQDSLDKVFPIADFYNVDRQELLDAVMRIFFPEQLALISERSNN